VGCGAGIAWYDNIPILSFFLLRGRCRRCHAPFSPRYAVVEILTACLFLAVWNRFGPTALTPVHLVVMSGLILATFVDIDHLIIPDRVSIGGMAAGLLASILVPALHATDSVPESLLRSIIGLAAGFGSLYVIGEIGRLLLKKEAMGFGDVKLLGAIGAFLGWDGVLFTVLVSSLAGSFVGILLIALRRNEWQGRIPYGPYLAAGAVAWILGGSELWAWYVDWMTGA